MRTRTVKLIAAKELLDTLRDRRTIFVALVLPLLLYPALLLGLTQIIGVTQRNLESESQKVWLVAGSASAELGALLREEKLDPVQVPDDAPLRTAVAGMAGDSIDDARASLRAILKEQGFAGALVCAEDFGQRLANDEQGSASLVFDPTDESSKMARRKLARALVKYGDQKRQSLRERFADEEQRLLFMQRPVELTVRETATSGQKGAYSFAPMLGILIVIMALTGAYYPAVDLAAGEKERGTMETLLVAPVTRTEIVLGKFMTIWIIAIVTALLNLFVMGITFSKLAGMMGGGVGAFALTPAAVFAVTLILVPTSALFSAVALALSSFATSFKEGQHYMTPLFIVVMPLGMVALLPNIEIGYALALVPVANVVLLVKAMLLGGDVIGPALVAALATAVYAVGAIGVAVAIFRRESVLFRGGAGRGYDAKSLKASRAGLPQESMGVLLFFVVLALMFFLSGAVESAGDALKALLLAQLAAVLAPTIFVAARLKVNLKETFSVRGFDPVLIPVILLAAASTLVLVFGGYMRYMPTREAGGFEAIIDELAKGSPIVFFCLLAVLPPICEEILCRGFLMASFRSRFGVRRAVVITALLFGALHLDLYRFPATFIAGLMLGFVWLRTRSIFACILFHATYNGIIAGTNSLPWLGERLDALGPLEMFGAAVALIASIGVLLRIRPATSELTSEEPDVHSATPRP